MQKKALVIDSTYVGNKPNRERNVINMSYWVKEKDVDLTIVTTKGAREFYHELFDIEVFEKIKFINLPLSKDFDPKGAVGVIVEYLKRVLGTMLLISKLRRIKCHNIYALTAIFPDVIITYLLKIIFPKSKTFVVFDNFVKKPSEREGSYLYNLVPFLSYKLSLFFMKKFDAVFTAMVEENLKKVFTMFKNKKAKIVPDTNGVNLSLINSVEVEEKIYDILYIGRLHKDKGIIDLLEIIGRVKKALPNVKVFIAGPMVTDIKEIIEKKIKDLGIKDNIKMINHIGGPYKYEVLKSSKIFCFFSYYESYPVSILEAMACKLKIYTYKLDVFNKEPFSLSDMQSFDKGDFDLISEKITEDLTKNLIEEKQIDLSFLDQTRSAELQYDNFI